MDNEKDTPKTINDIESIEVPKMNLNSTYNSNDSIEVNNLINLSNADITPDILEQLEARAMAELKKLNSAEENEAESKLIVEQPEDINLPEGLPAENGAVNITADILERPKESENIQDYYYPKKVNEKLDPLEEAKLNAAYRKYVIYINPENERFIDSLSIMERKKLINKILHEQDLLTEQQKREKEKQERVIKTFISIITFLVSVPLIYLLFNVSMEATIQNYKHSKSNFEVLYKETGKIKLNE